MPNAPEIEAAPPMPRTAASIPPIKISSSSSRPISRRCQRPNRVCKRFAASFSPTARYSGTGSCLPFNCTAGRVSYSSQRRLRARAFSSINRLFSGQTWVSRAERLTTSPTTVYSRRASDPTGQANTLPTARPIRWLVIKPGFSRSSARAQRMACPGESGATGAPKIICRTLPLSPVRTRFRRLFAPP